MAAKGKGPKQVFLDIAIGGKNAGRLVIELNWEKCPTTCENFKALCMGYASAKSGAALTYVGTQFFSIVKGWVATGGDNVNNNGTHGLGVFGRQMPKELQGPSHDSRGVVSMLNFELEPPRSQFFIMLSPGPWLDGEHPAFGKVVKGMEVLDQIEAQGTDSGIPKASVVIASCGQMDESGQLVYGASAEGHMQSVGGNMRQQKFAAGPKL